MAPVTVLGSGLMSDDAGSETRWPVLNRSKASVSEAFGSSFMYLSGYPSDSRTQSSNGWSLAVPFKCHAFPRERLSSPISLRSFAVAQLSPDAGFAFEEVLVHLALPRRW